MRLISEGKKETREMLWKYHTKKKSRKGIDRGGMEG